MPGSLLNTTNHANTPSEPAGPRQLTRLPTSPQIATITLPGSKKNSLNTYDSPLHSVYPSAQGSETSADEQSFMMLHGNPHGQRVSDSPASSAMAVHGSVPPSMVGYEGVFGVPHPQRGIKKTKWQEAGVDAKMAEVLEEHDVPSTASEVQEEVDITLGQDGEDQVKNGRVIALDFDDVCCQSMVALCQEHNERWGTNMKV